MKQYVNRVASRIDALTLRERAIAFVVASLVLITALNTFMLDPLFARNKQLSDQVKEEQAALATLQQQIQSMVKLQTADPDASSREQLARLTDQAQQMRASLQEIQKGLISADKMSGLLEGILRRHGNLRLVSLKNLPLASLSNFGEMDKRAEQPAGTDKGKLEESRTAEGLIYRHGVEITVQGGYLDMVNYLRELETMPSQVFWGKAVLNAEEYSKATLTLTLYTLSLDKRWLNI